MLFMMLKLVCHSSEATLNHRLYMIFKIKLVFQLFGGRPKPYMLCVIKLSPKHSLEATLLPTLGISRCTSQDHHNFQNGRIYMDDGGWGMRYGHGYIYALITVA